MIGLVLVTHFSLGRELLGAVKSIAGDMEFVQVISVDLAKDVEGAKKEISSAIKKVNNGDGVLILTDMFGGTPSNLSLAFLEEGKVEVLTGVNLPILLKITNSSRKKSLAELAAHLRDSGQKSICLASEILKKKVEPNNEKGEKD